MMIDLEGKTALVTGGSRGIGRAACVLLGLAGAEVVIAYHRNQSAAEETARETERAGVRTLTVAGDLSREADVERLFHRGIETFGKIDIVVANAGIWERAPIETMGLEEWTRTMRANLDSVYLTCRQAAAHMKPRGQGKLILIASTAGQRGEAEYSHYAASKGAIIAMTRSLGAELGPHGINVNAVAPGWVRTDMTAGVFADSEMERRTIEQIPLRRIASAEDIAGPILFLASELSRHLQGSVLSVNGGSVMA